MKKQRNRKPLYGEQKAFGICVPIDVLEVIEVMAERENLNRNRMINKLLDEVVSQKAKIPA